MEDSDLSDISIEQKNESSDERTKINSHISVNKLQPVIKIPIKDGNKISNIGTYSPKLYNSNNLLNNNTITEHNTSDSDNNWTYNIKFRVKAIGEKSMSYRWLHYQESEYYNKKDKKINLIIGILVSIMSVVSSSSIISTSTSDSLRLIIDICELSLTVLLGILIVIKEQGNYKQEKTAHLQLSQKFMHIYNDIIEIFSINCDQRQDGIKYLKEISKKYNGLMESGVMIRKNTLDLYMKATKNNSIQKPIITGIFDNININDTDENIKIDKPNANSAFEMKRWLQYF